MPEPARFAYFITPHGFGHAARTAAIVEALTRQLPGCRIDLWTSVPRWFFEESLTVPFRLQALECDVGLVQRSPVAEDLPASLAALDLFWNGADKTRLREVAQAVTDSGASGVICDIAPFGLDVARAAGLPAVLMENFTWDWIYEPLAASEPRFAYWAERLGAKFAQADLHLQLEPCCSPAKDALAVPPVARAPRRSREEIRGRLAIPPGDAMILVSFGGVEHRLASLAPLTECPRMTFVIPGACREEQREGNLRLLPHHSPVYHPDLVAAADVVVGKLGYSTVAECLAAGSRMLYVRRPGFRESAVLERYVGERLPTAALNLCELESGAWVAALPEILSRPRAPGKESVPCRGAAVAAGFVADWWGGRAASKGGQ